MYRLRCKRKEWQITSLREKGERVMVAFIAGMFVGSFVMLVIMSMMVAAKRADEASERWREK